MTPDLPPPLSDDDALALLASGVEGTAFGDAGPCPDANVLAALVDGACSPSDRGGLERHLSRCGPCRAVAATLSGWSWRESPSDEPDAEVPIGDHCGPVVAYPRRFGPYLLHRRLGGGGMGDVFEAEVPGRGRREALKQVRAGLEDDPRIAERFAREVRAIARVRHENVVPLFDSGCVEGVLYYTMPLLPGPSMARLVDEVRGSGESLPGERALGVLDRHGVPEFGRPDEAAPVRYVRRTAALFAGVARALDALHGAGLVHRDVKPGNLSLDERRRLVLGDFGLVRAEAARLTGGTESVGTPAFMAPEQLIPGAAVDGRADVYGLGASLYEVWTLHRPFESASVAEAVARILRGPPPASRTRGAALARDAATILDRAMARRPERRYARALTLAQDLEALAEGSPVSARARAWPERVADATRARWRPLAVAILVLLAASWAYLTRPTHLSIRAVRGADVALDGAPVGTAPIEGLSVRPGTHGVEVRHLLFEPHAVRVSVERGETHVVHLPQHPIDPADPKALRLLAEATGLDVHTVDPAGHRGPHTPWRLQALSPRGLLLEAPDRMVLWAEASAAGTILRLERGGDSPDEAPEAEWPLGERVGRITLHLDATLRARLVPGSAWRLRLKGGAGVDPEATEFRVAQVAKARLLRAELANLTHGRAPDDPVGHALRAEWAIGHGLWVDAVEHAANFAERLGEERREPARLALAALDGAGLRGSRPWADWATRYVRAAR